MSFALPYLAVNLGEFESPIYLSLPNYNSYFSQNQDI